ncbi:hypothetical protein ACE14D_22260, partial [Streptomyces sp. Act-28]
MSVRATAASEGTDPFGTARLRRGVLDAWGAGPARFREDANAEDWLLFTSPSPPDDEVNVVWSL